VVLIVGILIFTRMDPVYESVVLVALISYFFIYLLRLLKIIDKPFRLDDHTKDDVSLFLLNEFAKGVPDGMAPREAAIAGENS
jgi:hypothetical protein